MVGGAEVKVADRAAAEKLTNTRLFVDRARLPEPEDGRVLSRGPDRAGGGRRRWDGARHGRRGARLRRRGKPGDRCGERPPLLVPFTRASVPEVDRAARRVVVDRQRIGLLKILSSLREGVGEAADWHRRLRQPSPARGAGEGARMSWRASVLTLFPEMFPGPLGHSLAGRALRPGIWSLEPVNIRDFATDRHRTVDDTPFGGGAGMVLRPDVVDAAVASVADDRPLVFLTPRGRPLTQQRRRGAMPRRPASCCCAAATRASISASSRPAAWKRSASATTCCPAANCRRWCCSTPWCGCCLA